MLLTQISQEIKGTTLNNEYPGFSCNYSFLASNSFYVIAAIPQETLKLLLQAEDVSFAVLQHLPVKYGQSGIPIQ
ncbi:MAG: hypothetical protein HKL80_11820 [Acidimicrobiales bacterium]|nr:hypothetical protein [Acidimicrobiales bacterium]